MRKPILLHRTEQQRSGPACMSVQSFEHLPCSEQGQFELWYTVYTTKNVTEFCKTLKQGFQALFRGFFMFKSPLKWVF